MANHTWTKNAKAEPAISWLVYRPLAAARGRPPLDEFQRLEN